MIENTIIMLLIAGIFSSPYFAKVGNFILQLTDILNNFIKI